MFYLTKIDLKEFRCYENTSFSFSNKNKIIFVGQNASGKTSAVEAIYFLAFAKSFRTSKDDEIIKNVDNFSNTFYLKGSFSDGSVVEIGYDGLNKVIKKDNNRLKTLSQLVGHFMVSLFCPDDLLLVKGEPKNRRRFIDSSLCQVDNDYLSALQIAKKVLKERNEYLKLVDSDERKLNCEYLAAITQKFIDASEVIVTKRKKFIENINAIAKTIVGQISDQKDDINIEYTPNVNVDNFWITYKEKIMLDLYAKTTTWGPSRDDFVITINQKEAASCASQGQVRTACLALKLAVVEYYKKVTNNIIVILDDVFSELDEIRQNKILECISNNYQVFITTTNINLLTKKALENSEIIEISRGE